MSKIEVNAIEPQSGTTLTLGASGDTITIPAGATISNSGTAAGFGPTGAVSWDTTKKTSGFTAVSGVGYFCDTTSAAFTVTLPSSPSAGAVVGICDYANTFATNNLTLGRNGSNIGGVAVNSILATNGLSVTFVYVDATQGWIVTDSGNRSNLPTAQFVTATGGTILTCGSFKTHVFTGPGTFTVSCAGNSQGSNSVEYLVVAGGGGGGVNRGGGGGAGGFRQNYPSPTTAGLPVTATTYPITIGAGGTATPGPSAVNAVSGSPSIFSSITSAGGGAGGNKNTPQQIGVAGGSGGGGQGADLSASPGGAGNTPPVSPSQGNSGGTGDAAGANGAGGGGGGASASGSNATSQTGGPGGTGNYWTNPLFGPTAPSYGTSGPVPAVRYFAGGGGGAGWVTAGSGGSGGGGGGGIENPTPAIAGTVNTGGGGGAGGSIGGAAGGSGIVLIRYKFQ